MAVWKHACKTMQGMELDLKLVGRDGISLSLTKAKTGSGSISPTQLMTLTDVIGPVQELELLAAVECLDEKTVRLPVILKNTDVEEAYDMRQLGIYAEDPDKGEILYIVLQAEGAETVPSAAETKDFTLEWYLNLSVGNAENVEVAIRETCTLTVEEGDARYVKKEAGKGLSTNDFTDEAKEKLADTYNKKNIDDKLSTYAKKDDVVPLGATITDFNSVDACNPGFYRTYNALNAPEGKSTTFSVLVLQTQNGSGGPYAHQIAIEEATFNIYIRYVSNSRTFSEWKQANMQADWNVSDTGSNAFIKNKPAIPTALKNPNALTFTGGVTGSYDGSAAKTVAIPSKASDIGAAEDVAIFTSDDDLSPTSWTDMALVSSGVTNKSLWNRFSTAVKNLRYLGKMLGSTDISAIGDGTITGAIGELSSEERVNLGNGVIMNKFGRVVSIRYMQTRVMPQQYTTIATIPEKYRPKDSLRVVGGGATTDMIFFFYIVHTTGEVKIYSVNKTEATWETVMNYVI